MVIVGESWSKSCGFESQRHILDGHFFAFICCKNFNVSLKRLKTKTKKKPGLAHILVLNHYTHIKSKVVSEIRQNSLHT